MVVGSLTLRAFGFPANTVYSCSGPHGCAPLAQRIEHLTTDQKVGGSNPSWRANVKSRDIVHSMSRDFLFACHVSGHRFLCGLAGCGGLAGKNTP